MEYSCWPRETRPEPTGTLQVIRASSFGVPPMWVQGSHLFSVPERVNRFAVVDISTEKHSKNNVINSYTVQP